MLSYQPSLDFGLRFSPSVLSMSECVRETGTYTYTHIDPRTSHMLRWQFVRIKLTHSLRFAASATTKTCIENTTSFAISLTDCTTWVWGTDAVCLSVTKLWAVTHGDRQRLPFTPLHLPHSLPLFTQCLPPPPPPPSTFPPLSHGALASYKRPE